MTSERLPAPGDDGELIVTPETLGFRPHNCFACGELNVGGLHMELHLEPQRCWAELTLGDRFEGWEGIIHGGIITTLLDEVMAWSLIEADTWGVTARMDVQFRRPVVVGRAIRAEGWTTEVRRRLQRTAGQIVDVESGEVLATAEATYVAAPENRKRELKDRYGFRSLKARPGGPRSDAAPPEEAGSTAGGGRA